MIRRWVEWAVAHGWVTTALCLAICGILAAGLPGVNFSSSPRDFLGQDSSYIQRLTALEAKYVKDDVIMVMLRPENPAATVFKPDFLHALKQITDAAWQLPYVQRVDSLINFQYSRARGDDLVVSDLVEDTQDLSEADLQQIREVALNTPELAGLLVAKDGGAAAVNLTLNIDITDPAKTREIVDALDALTARVLAQHPGIKSNLSGSVRIADGWLRALEKDIRYLYPSVVALLFVTMAWFFGSLLAGFFALLIGLLSVAGSVGLVGHFGGILYPPTMVGVLLVLMLALADSIHVAVSVRRHIDQGMALNRAIIEAVKLNFYAIGLTSLTTAVGFLAFVTSEFAGTRTMGLYVAAGVLLAWGLSISLLPALLTFCRLKPRSNRGDNPRFRWLADRVLDHRRAILWLVLPALLVSVYGISLNRVDDNVAKYIGKNEPTRVDMDAVQAHLTGTNSLIFDLRSGESGGVTDPAFMRQVDAFSTWMREQPNVRNVNSYTDVIKRLNANLHGDDPQWRRIPESRELAAQYLLLYELSLPYGLDLTNRLDLDKSSTRLVATVNDIDMGTLLRLSDRAEDWMAENTPRIAGSRGNGSAVMISKSVEVNLQSMVAGAFGALVIIALILLFAFRALVPGLLGVVMVVSPLIAAFGIWGFARGTVGLSAAIALCMVIGIVVDNAVHFISKFRHAIKNTGASAEDAIRYSFTTVGPALATNTMVLSAGFGILLFSAFRVNATIGALTVLSMALTLAGTFTLLPSLLLNRAPNRRNSTV